jgi:hypothetical protein
MSDDKHARRTAVSGVESVQDRLQSTRKLVTMIVVAMSLLAIVGTGITFANVRWAEKYWLVLVPVYGILCIAAAWHRQGFAGWLLVRQILHWLVIGAAIALDFVYLHRTGDMASAGTGLSALLLLAVGCLLAGIHVEWLFGLVGLLLLGIVIVVSVAQEYMPLIFVAGGVVMIIALAANWLRKK